MARTLSLDEFSKMFPQYGSMLVSELNYAVRQETAKEVLEAVRANTPVAKGDAASFITLDGRTVKGYLTKGSISKVPGELKRSWRILRGSRSPRGMTRVVAGGVAAIANEPHRRLPKGGAVGSKQSPQGITPPAERAVATKTEPIKAKAIARTEALLARRFKT